MNAYDIMTRYGISGAAWAAMAEATVKLESDGKVVGLAVRATDIDEDDPRFFYDVDWLKWFEVTYPDLFILGGMAPVDMDTNNTFTWFVAVAPR